jgi:tetratricopeptide (TPR) repeat protein
LPGGGFAGVGAVKKLYDYREIARLLGISEGCIRHWSRLGLIPHQEESKGRLSFDFQGLVAFRTMRDLRRQGVSLGCIKKCLEKLRRMMPDLKQPLAEVKFSLHKGQIVLGKNRQRFILEGQMLMDFSAEHNPLAVPGELYEELFCQALRDEEEGKLDGARKKYEAILAAVPEHVDALVNLGNILYLTGSEGEAASRYLQALGINPDHVEANYNLANLLESRGEMSGAIVFYRKATQEDPDFADAHFNLAMVLEAMGDVETAKEYWRKYLVLDPESQWRDYIRQRLEEG